MADPKPKRKRGCFFYGAMTAAVLLLVLALGAFLGLCYAKGLVNKLTDTKPMPLPTVHLSQVQMFQLRDRVDTFKEDVRDGEATEPLELSADELNALIETDPSMTLLRNHLFVAIDGSQLHAQISFPAEDLGMVQLRGRYINANGVFNVGLTNQELTITAESLDVKGKPLPRNIMREVTVVNLADRFNQNPKSAAGLRKIQAIEVKGSKLILVPKK
jgi:hypothetical protein